MLDKQVIKTTEQLLDETPQPNETTAELAVVLGEREMRHALEDVVVEVTPGASATLSSRSTGASPSTVRCSTRSTPFRRCVLI